MLPAAMCTGCPVKSTWRQPTIWVKGQFFLNWPISLPGSTAATGGGVGVGCWPQTAEAAHNNRTNVVFLMVSYLCLYLYLRAFAALRLLRGFAGAFFGVLFADGRNFPGFFFFFPPRGCSMAVTFAIYLAA